MSLFEYLACLWLSCSVFCIVTEFVNGTLKIIRDSMKFPPDEKPPMWMVRMVYWIFCLIMGPLVVFQVVKNIEKFKSRGRN